MTKILQPTKVYLSADALFDLRLGTLLTISQEFALEVTTNPKYYVRTSDVFSTEKFGELDRSIYESVFSTYKEEVLKNSVVTKILSFVMGLILELVKQKDRLGIKNGIDLEVNTYPFVFTDQEAADLIRLIISRIGKVVSISIIYKEPEELTTEYVASNYLAVIMYKYHDWFNLHNDSVKKRALQNVAFYLPRVNFLSEFTKEDKEKLAKHKTDPFELFSKAMKYFAPIQFAPIGLFSADLPGNNA